jgi:hypothetical protein
LVTGACVAALLRRASCSAAQRGRYAAFDAARRILCEGRYGQKPALAVTAD